MKLHRSNDNDNDNNTNVSGSFLVLSSDNLTVNNPLFERRVELATEGLEPSYLNKLKRSLSQTNALTIADYILAMKTEINQTDFYEVLGRKEDNFSMQVSGYNDIKIELEVTPVDATKQTKKLGYELKKDNKNSPPVDITV